MKILFLGETYRADAITWMRGVEQNAGVKLQTLEVAPSPVRWKRVANLGLFFFSIIQINRQQWDLVLAERATSYGFFSLFVRAKVRIVAQQGITDAFPLEGFAVHIKRWLQRRVYRNVDLIHAWGHVMVPAMLNSGADPSKITVLPKGIDLNRFHGQKRKVESPQGKVIGIVTRSLYPEYRHEDILMAMAEVRKTFPNVEVWIVGDGVLKAALERKSQDLGLEENLKFLGRIPNDELPDLLAQSDFYLSVPISEGVSASLFEAMASGCFPIVSELPAYKAFLKDGQNGLLVPVCDSQALAKAVLRYLADPGRYEPGVIQNRKYIEQHVDFHQNMKALYGRYLAELSNK
ncbi:glycosyltransferase [Algoriphagus sp. H41]|uniref:Glycosyltransferase n=1 Tax=Algoriphagus oliviformis TaxID=2811231 RepID=A0ABS3C9S3_9BACT|nr:glycosyltransferase [Algoriphagus oliviformis]MBN7812911.1 glycosyltransferase [Algoriphagus oliviformis]